MNLTDETNIYTASRQPTDPEKATLLQQAQEIWRSTGRGHCCQSPQPTLTPDLSTALAALRIEWKQNAAEADRLIVARDEIDAQLDALRRRQFAIAAEGKRLLFPCLTDGGEVRLEGES